MSYKVFWSIILVMMVILLGTTSLAAQELAATGPSDPAEMEAFFDGMMLAKLEEGHVAGVTVAVVSDDEIFFSKGYGYADIAEHTLVDPATTLFRIGSTSKLFTWTAVMQLVEQGILDLDADINTYLDFEIPATYAEPITLAHLLSHTAGFEDRSYGIYAADADTLQLLGEWMATHIPARVRPPGIVAGYSNYGTSLAGYIVELASGMNYAETIDQNILQPLGMTHSTFHQPLPAKFENDMSQGYRIAGRTPVPQAFELLHVAPAGAMSATATDMAHFMIAHLQNGRYEDERILETTTAQQMHARLFTHDDRILGMAHGFWEADKNGQRIIGHGGDTLFFHTELALLVDENIGVFISCNTAECMGFPQKAFDAFMAHYYPVEDVVYTPTTDFAERADLVTGLYRSNRTSYTTAESLLNLLSTVAVTIREDGMLMMKGAQYIETEPFVYRQVNGDSMLVAHQDEGGTVTHIFSSGQPAALERVPGLDTPSLHFALLGLCVFAFLSVIIGAPVIYLARWGCAKIPQPRLAQIARWLLVGASLLCFFLLVSVGLTAASSEPAYDGFSLIIVWTIVIVIVFVLAIILLGMVVIAWRNRYWGVAGRVHYTFVMLCVWAFIWFANYWHLLTW